MHKPPFCQQDYDWCPADSLNDANDNGICDSYEISGCMDIIACNYDSTANVDSGMCEFETCQDCTGDLFGEAIIDECGLCSVCVCVQIYSWTYFSSKLVDNL